MVQPVMLIDLFLSLSLITVFEFTAIAETAMGSGLCVHQSFACMNVNVGQRD